MTWDFILRLLLASALGAVIGLEREYRAKEAGLRTHFLVAMGSALFMIVSKYAFDGIGDPSRVAAQVVTGIGFIGAGTIIIQKQFVRGLTTAAGLWATAGIGLAAGGGLYWEAVGATLLALAGLELFNVLLKNTGWRSSLFIYSTTEQNNLREILAELHNKAYHMISYSVDHDKVGDADLFRVTLVIKTRYYMEESHLFQFMQGLPDLTIEKME